MFEISHDPFRSLDQALHESGRLVQQRFFGGKIRRVRFSLEDPVQVFSRLDIKRARQEIGDFDLIVAFSERDSDQLGVTHFQVAEQEENFLAAIENQPLHETKEQIGIHGFLNGLEANQTLIVCQDDNFTWQP